MQSGVGYFQREIIESNIAAAAKHQLSMHYPDIGIIIFQISLNGKTVDLQWFLRRGVLNNIVEFCPEIEQVLFAVAVSYFLAYSLCRITRSGRTCAVGFMTVFTVGARSQRGFENIFADFYIITFFVISGSIPRRSLGTSLWRLRF